MTENERSKGAKINAQSKVVESTRSILRQSGPSDGFKLDGHAWKWNVRKGSNWTVLRISLNFKLDCPYNNRFNIELTSGCISPSFCATFVLVNLVFFKYLLAFLKSITVYLKKQKAYSMKCSIFRTYGKSEN